MTNGHTLVIRFGKTGCAYLTDGKLQGLNPCGKKETKIYIEQKDELTGDDARPFGLCESHLIDPETMPDYFREFDVKDDRDQEVMLREVSRE